MNYRMLSFGFAKVTVTAGLLVGVYSFQNTGTPNDKEPNESPSPLAAYGSFIFQREKCASCHSLNANENPDLITLDGLGGKYSDYYHFLHLIDPKSVSPNSSMPAYVELASYKMSMSDFEKSIANDMTQLDDKGGLWEAARVEADQIYSVLQVYKVGVEQQTEILALISYLQQISSKEQNAQGIVGDTEVSVAPPPEWIDPKGDLMQFANSKDPSVIQTGQNTFNVNCTPCHGSNGAGIVGPNLTDDYWLHGALPEEIASTIMNGIPEKGMRAWKHELTPKQIGSLVAFIHSLKGSNPPNAKAPQGVKN
jgi:mono/diheme cytochrome c family protein